MALPRPFALLIDLHDDSPLCIPFYPAFYVTVVLSTLVPVAIVPTAIARLDELALPAALLDGKSRFGISHQSDKGIQLCYHPPDLVLGGLEPGAHVRVKAREVTFYTC